ncbi:MAG: hypothetical protein WA463_19645 [Terriglobales bacterium]
MRAKLLVAFAVLLAVMLFPSGCGTQADCPTCGTTKNGAYTLLLPIPVPEHNPTGEPGGPFNSFDISVVDSVNHRFFVSDRIGLDVVVIDTLNNVAVNFFAGANGVAGGGVNASPCITDTAGDIIPPIVSSLGNWTRFGCRTASTPPFHIPGFGANGLFGGFPGAQCCAARANGVNPLSGPDGEVLSPDNKTLFIANGSSSIVAFDLTSTTYSLTPGGGLPPAANVIAAFATGVSPDYDGPSGIGPCVASANGRAFSDASCGDLRADEMSIGVANGRTILLVANGDPGFPFVTLIDVTNIVKPTGTVASFAADHCLPVASTTPYGPVLTGSGQGSAAPAAGPINPPTCIIGQIYYDGALANNVTVNIDDVGPNSGGAFPCPDPSTTALSGMTGHGGGVNILGPDRPCHHGPQLITTVAPLPADQTAFCANQITPPGTCFGAVAIAGIGGSAFNAATGRFLVSNSSASATDLTYGTIDEIDPRVGNPNGPVVVASLKTPNCMPSGIVQGPGNQFLVGCADHDGETFPVNEYIVDCTANCKIIDTIDKVGGVDETWYNPGDNRYYLAARDMPDGPKMGVIDAGTHQWLVNVPTNSNSHSISVDSTINHVFVPLQSGSGVCLTQSSNGCVGVYAQQ